MIFGFQSERDFLSRMTADRVARTAPSGRRKKSISAIPRISAAVRASRSRIRAVSCSLRPCPPFSPDVKKTTRTRSPSSTCFRMLPPQPIDSSSGWGLITRTRLMIASLGIGPNCVVERPAWRTGICTPRHRFQNQMCWRLLQSLPKVLDEGELRLGSDGLGQSQRTEYPTHIARGSRARNEMLSRVRPIQDACTVTNLCEPSCALVVGSAAEGRDRKIGPDAVSPHVGSGVVQRSHPSDAELSRHRANVAPQEHLHAGKSSHVARGSFSLLPQRQSLWVSSQAPGP